MEEKKGITVRLSTVILLFIIFILLVLLGIVYFQKNDNKNIVNTNQNNFNNVASPEQKEPINNTEKTNNIVETTPKDEYKITFKYETYKSYKESGEVTFENTRNLPVIINEANQAAADKIVKSLTTISDKAWEKIKESSDEYREFQYTAGVQYLLNTYINKENYLVFKAIQSGSFGGVGWNAEEFYNYDAKTGELLTLESISTDYANFKKMISDKVRDYISNNIEDVLVSDVDQAINDILNQDGNWGFTETGINIQLPKYSIGSGADGVRTVKIDKSDVNSYLLEEYKIR